MEEELIIAGFIKTSTADGPGVRSVLFFQGCSRGCPSCHNQNISRKEGGIKVSVSNIVSYIKKHCKNRKLTISGGEPLEQLSGLLELLQELKSDEFDLCLYTGFEKADIPQSVINNLHYLKTGRFIKDKIYPMKPFCGSNNQEFTVFDD